MKTNKTIKIELSQSELISLFEWYRGSHHFHRCGQRVRTCHKLKKKLFKALNELEQKEMK